MYGSRACLSNPQTFARGSHYPRDGRAVRGAPAADGLSQEWDRVSGRVIRGSDSRVSRRLPQSYLMYLKRGSSGVPSSALCGPGRQLTVSSIMRASSKSLSVIPFAEWVLSLTITKA